MNAVYDAGHHGNAVLSRYPIARWDNQDISAHRFESRGLLHCELALPRQDVGLHCICVHLGLSARGRGRQFNALVERIRRVVPEHAPLIVAGDFNDWRARKSGVSERLLEALGLHEAFEITHGRPARPFPAFLPMLTLDRIYVRGLKVLEARRLHGTIEGSKWRGMSDHAGLAVRLALK